MRKRKKNSVGKRFNISLPPQYWGTWGRLENKSKFVQLCLEDAAGIMAWAILRERDKAFVNTKKIEDVIGEYNETFPLDPITQRRLDKKEAEKCESSAPKQEIW